MSEKSLIKRICKQALNNDMVFCKFRDVLASTDHEVFFIKPDSDTKEFAGTVLDREEFLNWTETMLESGYVDDSIMDLDVGISYPINLGCEWRFVIVDGKVSSCSYYRQYQRVMPELGAPRKVIEYVEWIAAQFENPAPVYVMDIAEVKEQEYQGFGKYRVIECNTFNSAGLYKADVSKIIDDINSYIEKTYNVIHA